MLQYQLRKASLAENDAFALLKADNHGDFITRSSFYEALCQVLCNGFFSISGRKFSGKVISLYSIIMQMNVIGHPHGLSFQETEALWNQADSEGYGIIDYEKFQVIWFIVYAQDFLFLSVELSASNLTIAYMNFCLSCSSGNTITMLAWSLMNSNYQSFPFLIFCS